MLKARIKSQVTLIFVRGGMSTKPDKPSRPYLQCSNGRKEFFFSNVAPGLDFSSYSEEDFITLEVEVLVGSDSVSVLKVFPTPKSGD